MSQELTLFVGMFTTLLAIINPLEALPVFLKLLEGKDEAEHQPGRPPIMLLRPAPGIFLSLLRAISYCGFSAFR